MIGRAFQGPRDARVADCRLADLSVGVPARILSIDDDATQLATHGFHPGVALTVELDAPFGGPRIIRLGTARIAVAASVARSVRVRPETTPLTTAETAAETAPDMAPGTAGR